MQLNEQKETNISWDVICKAQKDESVRTKLKKRLAPWIAQIAEEYIEKENISKETSKEKLVKAGFSKFKTALDKYHERMQQRKQAGEDLYPFKSYFVWWVSRGIKRHLGIAEPYSLWTKMLLRIRNNLKIW